MTGVEGSICSFFSVGSEMTNADFHLVARPRQRGRPLTYEEKWLVHHVFETFAKEKKTDAIVRIEDPYSLTSQYTGVARSLVATIAQSVRQTGSVPVSTSPGNRQQPTAIPGSTEGRIREFIFDQHRQGTICHAKHVKALLKDAFGLEVQERTVQRHLSRMGFGWLRTKNRPRSLREKAEVRQQRHDYLYVIRKNRHLPSAQRYQVVYVDESFLHHHHGGQYSWFSAHDFVERMSGKGRRWCFIHAMQEDALIEGAFLAFEAKKSRGDYHGQFDWEIFQHWFTEQLLLNVPPRSLIVLDRCAFHTVCRDSIVPSQMKKVELQEWLTKRGIQWEEPWLRARLMQEVDRYRDKKPMVEVFAEAQGHKVLFLPVHHPELNPIELLWGRVKNYCGVIFSNSTSFKEQRQHLEESFKKDITPEYCTNVYEHVQKIEEKYWRTDLMIDDEIEIEDDESTQF
jgi:transposase